MILADSGINWMDVYEVTHMDDDICVMRELGQFHKFEAARGFDGKVDHWIQVTGQYATIAGKRRLIEIVANPNKRGR